MKADRIKVVIGLIITVVLLWWTLRDVSFATVWAEIRRADEWLLAAAVVVATFGFVLRAVRWRILLLPAHGGSSFRGRFGSTCIGFMVNNIFPARLGEFARWGRWAEWNGRFRDGVRRFWRGDRGMLSEFATRLTGSDDLYATAGYGAASGVNYLASHDGATVV